MSNRTDDLAERGVEVLKRIAVATLSLDDASCIAGWVHDARNALRAQGGVRVKPLEWEEFWNRSEAKSTVGDYIIMPRRDGAFDWRLDGVVSCWSSSSEGAKAAAQADYERRILSSLEASPAGAGGVDVASVIATTVCGLETLIEWSDGRSTDAQWANLHGAIQEIVTAALAANGGQ